MPPESHTVDASEPHHTSVGDTHAECTCGWRSPTVWLAASSWAEWHRLAVDETIDNPYLRTFLAARTPRDRLTAEYAWAIPIEGVLRRLAELSPICDLGCGTGYWAKLLRDVGAEVIAVDASPPLEGENHWHRKEVGFPRQSITLRHFVDVIKGDASTFDVPSGHTLMLCWPPYKKAMAVVALERYRGTRVIYVGEGGGGCTADDAFHAMLAKQWDLVSSHEIPQWDGLHDAVHVYVRRIRGLAQT